MPTYAIDLLQSRWQASVLRFIKQITAALLSLLRLRSDDYPARRRQLTCESWICDCLNTAGSGDTSSGGRSADELARFTAARGDRGMIPVTTRRARDGTDVELTWFSRLRLESDGDIVGVQADGEHDDRVGAASVRAG
jgi:hypothetical protein